MKNKKLITALCGAAIGFVNGLLGAGGGMLAVPLLKKYVPYPHRKSTAMLQDNRRGNGCQSDRRQGVQCQPCETAAKG